MIYMCVIGIVIGNIYIYRWMSTPRERGIYFEKLAHVTVVDDKSKLTRASQQAGDRVYWYSFQPSKGWKTRQNFLVAVWRKNSFFLGKPWSLLLRFSTDWMRPTRVLENNLLYLKSTNCKHSSYLKIIFTAASRLTRIWPNWAPQSSRVDTWS